MKGPKKEAKILGRLLQKIAPRIGAKVVLEPEWEFVGQITFKNGKRSYFKYNALDLNPVGSADVAKDKDYANFFMESLGYRIVPGSKTFYSNDWGRAIDAQRRNIDTAYTHATKLGFPVVVKPNSGSQGSEVALVYTKREFYSAMRRIFRSDRVALVQQPVKGRDYRIVVLDDEVISAYERMPLSVMGDGRTSIMGLLKKKQKAFVISNRDTRIPMDDPRMKTKLTRAGQTFSSVLPKGEQLFLLDNANLSSGGDAVDVTNDVHPAFKKLAVALTRDMGLRICGVDIMVDGSIAENPDKYWILEINAAPGLDHYARMGKSQEKIVENLYLEVLKHLER